MRTAAAVLLGVLAAVPAGAADGTVEVKLRLPSGAGPAVTVRIGSLEAPVSGGAHRFDAVPSGRHAVTVEAPPAAAGGGRFLGVAEVVVPSGASAAVTVDVVQVRDVDAFCGACHPAPGGAPGKGGMPRDLHVSGVTRDQRAVDCLACHTAHRDAGNTAYATAPFREKGELCQGCHDRGHAARDAAPEPCLACHTLSAAEAEPGTSLISAASRTLPLMKGLGRGKAPEVFGCTYCHGNSANRERMRDVLTGFSGGISKHPVGFDLRTRKDTMGEYLSSTATRAAAELECTDCHDPRLLVDPSASNAAGKAPYANHVPRAAKGRTGNPAMLLVAAPGDLCRTCHGRGEKFAKADAVVKSHGEKTLVESDGTPLKTSECGSCHNSHFSNNFKLFGDGSGGRDPVRVGDAAACTAVCHQRGDAGGAYDRLGHGGATTAAGRPMNIGCGSCHAVDARHDGNGPKMLTFEEDARKSKLGTSLTSICHVCHRRAVPHGGASGAGCLDCHDVHGEGVSDAGGTNLAMVPRSLPATAAAADARPAVFERAGAAGSDFYRSSGDGLCDNAACHRGLSSSKKTPAAPLSGLMQGGRHGGGDRAPGSNCRECHRHDAAPEPGAKDFNIHK